MDDYRVYVTLKGVERDEAEAFAQGAANLLGSKAELIRVDHGDEIHTGTFNPKKKGA